jgi:cob(I)alamin adenosyltransferase
VDELNAAIGLARSTAESPFVGENLLLIQKQLVTLMGELATQPEDLARYVADGYSLVTNEMTLKLEQLVKEIEGQKISFKGWATPGDTLHSAALDMARTIARRSERHACSLQENQQLNNPEILVYLNRLSDLLWLLARWAEQKKGEH